jgi:hypothetical protein
MAMKKPRYYRQKILDVLNRVEADQNVSGLGEDGSHLGLQMLAQEEAVEI